MKSKQFSVPTDLIIDFSRILEENELSNEILGADDNNEDRIIVEVRYERDEREAILDLLELLEGEDQDDD